MFWANSMQYNSLSMALSIKQEREQAHALLDLLSPAKLSIVRALLKVMVDDNELTAQDRKAIQAGLDSMEEKPDLTVEDLLADLGLTMADFEKIGEEAGEERLPRSGLLRNPLH
jgi:hypothetical protein